MQIETIMTDSWNIFKNNIVAYIIGALIAVIGLIFVMTQNSLSINEVISH